MRRLGYLMLILVVLIGVVPALWKELGRLDPARPFATASADWKLDHSREASVSLAYRIERKDLDFALPPGTARLKLVAHARFPEVERIRARQAADPAWRCRHAFEIELRDADGRVLLRRTQHFRSKLSEWRDTAGRRITATYLLTEDATPSDGAVLHLDLTGLGQVATVRLRLDSHDAEADGVLVRLYAPEPISERQLGTLWQRLHEAQKDRLARGSVFAHELLLEEEKRNLMRNRWQPLAPQGTSGEDFEAVELYVLREPEGERIETGGTTAGLLELDSQRRVVVPLPEGGGEFRFELTPLEAAQPVSFSWFGALPAERRQWSLAPSAATQSWQGRLDGGLVELASAGRHALRVLQLAPEATEITPATNYERVFLATPGDPVDYALAHEGEAATPLRLALRSLVASPGAAPAQAEYRFHDETGAVLASGRLEAGRELSLHDSVISEIPGTCVSEAHQLFFSVPPGSTRLALHALAAAPGQAALLVSLASRPPGLARQVREPEDRYDFDRHGARIPAWFELRPLAYERRILEHRSRLLTVQPRPPEAPRNDVASAQWQDYRPAGEWLARHIFAPRDGEAAVREDALPATFTPLAAGRELSLDFPRWHGLARLSPTLVWLAEGTPRDGWQARLQVDGEAPVVLRGRGPHGEIALPPLTAGRHRLRVDTDPGLRLYINHALPRPDSRIKRLALRLQGVLRFDYDRRGTEEEFLTARLFQGGAAAGRRARLSIRVEGPPPAALTPLPAWVFEQRLADVRADERDPAPVFSTAGETVDAGRGILIPFPEGSPPGRYRIEIEALPGADGERYLALSRLAAVPEARRRLHFEGVPDATP